MKPVKRPPVQTQFLVFTLFGDYILPREGTIWAADLLHLLELLGVSERAARSALSRMARKGWLIARRYGRQSQYSLTARGWALLEEGGRRIFEPPFTDGDGLWHVVVYSLPEKKRGQRHALRQQLAWLGFGRLAPATWVSPHNRKPELESIFNELGVQQHVELFSGMRVGPSPEQKLIEQCWDLPGLEAGYRQFIARYRAEYKQCQAQGNGNLNLSPADCFARRFWLTHDFQPFPRKDPNLPNALLPPDWIGFAARQLFDNYRRLLGTHANQFVDDVVAGEWRTCAGGASPQSAGAPTPRRPDAKPQTAYRPPLEANPKLTEGG
ncbi:MAG: PaaX family transcriptional regulator C-terminal domain-containing protein [Anaerolineae bacterium]